MIQSFLCQVAAVFELFSGMHDLRFRFNETTQKSLGFIRWVTGQPRYVRDRQRLFTAIHTENTLSPRL